MAKNRQSAKETSKATSKKAATSANRACSTKSESDCCGCGKSK